MNFESKRRTWIHLLAVCALLLPAFSFADDKAVSTADASRGSATNAQQASANRVAASGDTRSKQSQSATPPPSRNPFSMIGYRQFVEQATDPYLVESPDSVAIWQQPGICCNRPFCLPCRFSNHKVWVRAEFLLWSVEGFSIPELVSTSPAGTDRSIAGVLGESTTTVLLGNERFVQGVQPGGRLQLGLWLDPCQTRGIQASYFSLASRDETYAANSQNHAILARPFFNVEPGFEAQDAELVAFPGLLDGQIQVTGETRLQAADILFRQLYARQCERRVDLLFGYRYASLEEDLTIRDFKTAISGDTGFVIGTTIDETDAFSTSNEFNGAVVGAAGNGRWRNWTLEWLTKVALGNTSSSVAINGSTTITVPVSPPDVALTPAGLLAQQTNTGVYKQDAFSVIPELNLTLGYNITRNLRATAGYSLLYWSRVARPGDQIDTNLNLSQLEPDGLIGAPRPQFEWRIDDVWAQGLNLGLDYRF